MSRKIRSLSFFIVLSLILSLATFAASTKKTITVEYAGIQLYVDGTKVSTTIEPFIYKGSVYLPVSVVGKAIGKDVSWDSTTKTVYIGEKPTVTADTSTKKEVIVYITKTGSKYHTGSCSYLRSSKIAISLSDAKAEGYTPCSRCNPPR